MVTVGLDEVGRGCWAGPLVAAAVLLDSREERPMGLRDSKKLSRKQREKLDVEIRSQVKAYGVGWVTPGEIDKLGLTESVRLAMLRAMKDLHKTCIVYDEIIVDGNYNFFANEIGLNTTNIKAVIKADDASPEVSAASIIAKVARDSFMRNISRRFPGYGFENHVGYGTAEHIAALEQRGVTEIHRKSFKPVRTFLARKTAIREDFSLRSG